MTLFIAAQVKAQQQEEKKPPVKEMTPKERKKAEAEARAIQEAMTRTLPYPISATDRAFHGEILLKKTSDVFHENQI